MFDGYGTPHRGWAVAITDDKIVAAGPAESLTVPAGAQTSELPGTTLLPGLIDLQFYALNKSGHVAGVSMYGGRGTYAVCDEGGARTVPIDYLLDG